MYLIELFRGGFKVRCCSDLAENVKGDKNMDLNLKKIVMFVVILVVGIMVITLLVPQFALTILNRPDLSTWTGLGFFVSATPFLLLLGLIAGDLIFLFGVDKTVGLVRRTWRRSSRANVSDYTDFKR